MVSTRAIFSVFLTFVVLWVYASSSVGTISPGSNLTKICQDTACTTFGLVNWKPTLNASTSGATAVTITDTSITGHLWGNEIGWINLSPTGQGITVNPTTGIITGYAYAASGSWINFAPTYSWSGPAVGVTINTLGEFSWYAFVSGIKWWWMKFDCSIASTCIKTDWRPLGARSECSDGIDNDSDGKIDYSPLAGSGDGGCTSTSDTSESVIDPLDTDGDGVPNSTDADIDNDALPNIADTDIDGDGISNLIETAGPNQLPAGAGADGNGDGIADKLQSHVANVPILTSSNAGGTNYQTLELTSTRCLVINAATGVAESTIGDLAGYDFPLGLVSYRIQCDSSSNIATVRVYFSTLRTDTALWQFKKSIWTTYSDASGITVATASVGFSSPVTYYEFVIQDGSLWDEDSLANASITDPIGPAISAVVPVTPGGGGGGGGGWFSPTPTQTTPTTTNTCTAKVYRNCDLISTVKKPVMRDFKESLLCEKFIDKLPLETDYKYEINALRRDVLHIAVNMTKKPVVAEKDYTNHFQDVDAKKQPTWLKQIVETGLAQKLITSANTDFRPESDVSRSEAFAMIMSSVCLKPIGNDPNWQINTWLSARTQWLTSKAWMQFEPNKPVLRQELFVIAARAADWAERTGGCTPRAAICLGNVMTPIQEVDVFSLIDSSEKEDVYSYVVRVGGNSGGIENLFRTLIGVNYGQTLRVTDTVGNEYLRWALFDRGQQVYVRINKINNTVLPVAEDPIIPVAAPVRVPWVFTILSDTDAESIYSYIVKSGGTPGGVRNQFIKLFGKAQTPRVTSEEGKVYYDATWLVSGTEVFVHVKKPVLQVVSPEPVITPAPVSDTSSIQAPGTFVLVSETAAQIIFRYIVKTGGNGGWVENAFEKQIGKKVGETLTLTMIDGTSYSRNSTFKAGQEVYVQIDRPVSETPLATPVSIVETTASIPETTSAPELGIFVLVSDTPEEQVYSYRVKTGGNTWGVINAFVKNFGVSAKQIRVTDIGNTTYQSKAWFESGMMVYVHQQK